MSRVNHGLDRCSTCLATQAKPHTYEPASRLYGRLCATSSHAWCSAWCPGAGWVDFDPTNNCVPSDGHITVAWGRDYSDVSPIYGVLLGGARHKLHVEVDVMPVE